ncbi:hypothetical protein AURDEDRAFT_121456 [Auricularia subglabra TFB-10046 SS5]|nr:hypothetical protein AURDEDRAFT_121456 [Auricularia subglabra TFB-10046 SS5]
MSTFFPPSSLPPAATARERAMKIFRRLSLSPWSARQEGPRALGIETATTLALAFALAALAGAAYALILPGGNEIALERMADLSELSLVVSELLLAAATCVAHPLSPLVALILIIIMAAVAHREGVYLVGELVRGYFGRRRIASHPLPDVERQEV